MKLRIRKWSDVVRMKGCKPLPPLDVRLLVSSGALRAPKGMRL